MAILVCGAFFGVRENFGVRHQKLVCGAFFGGRHQNFGVRGLFGVRPHTKFFSVRPPTKRFGEARFGEARLYAACMRPACIPLV